LTFGFYSTMRGAAWGGSEELWSRTAGELLARGERVAICHPRKRPVVNKLQSLVERGAKLHRHSRITLGHKVRNLLRQVGYHHRPFAGWLKRTRPDLLLISAGYHIDGLGMASTCRLLGIPYAILLQSAGPCHWVHARDLDQMRAAYLCAERVFLVSHQNRRTVEENLAIDLSRAEIIDNPFNVHVTAAPAWRPADETPANPWRLAHVGRLHCLSKGQDLLLQVLRMPKWRARPLEITLYGGDSGSERVIRETIGAYGLERQVKLGGFVSDVEGVWAQHHGLVLPSRYEGNPLALIEALLCGRMAIATDVGRAAELVEEGRGGFIAPAPTVELFDAALERAWLRRHDWQAMGQHAGRTIRTCHSLQPEVDFADRLLGSSRAIAAHRRAA
jgi:glycosyltransferase involved in cell wall biosynthesis